MSPRWDYGGTLKWLDLTGPVQFNLRAVKCQHVLSSISRLRFCRLRVNPVEPLQGT